MSKTLVFLSCMCLFSCKQMDSHVEKKEKVLAKVGNRTLTHPEAKAALGNRLNQPDSVQVLESYVQSWIKNQAMHAYALEHLTAKQLNKDSLLNNYYMDLVAFELQKAYLDTVEFDSVSESEIMDYYAQYPSNFVLTENIVRINFYKIPLHVKRLNVLWEAFNREHAKDVTLLKQVTEMAGGSFYLNDTIWLSFSDVQKEIPIVTYNQENFLNYNKKFRLRDEKFAYFVDIKDFKIKNSKSPIEFEREKIRGALENKRKLTLLQQMERRIVREMYENQRIEKH